MFLLNEGKIGDESILPDGWVKEATSPITVNGKVIDYYGYMTWLLAKPADPINEGAFDPEGIFGQHIYVNPKQKLVIVLWGATPKPEGGNPLRYYPFFAAVANALKDQ
jgi:CubicO group peptidase (beta-lactamase class C family)